MTRFYCTQQGRNRKELLCPVVMQLSAKLSLQAFTRTRDNISLHSFNKVRAVDDAELQTALVSCFLSVRRLPLFHCLKFHITHINQLAKFAILLQHDL